MGWGDEISKALAHDKSGETISLHRDHCDNHCDLGSSKILHTPPQSRAATLKRLREHIRRIEDRVPVLGDISTTENDNNYATNNKALGNRALDRSLAAGSPSGLLVEDGGTNPRNAHAPVPSSSPQVITVPSHLPSSIPIADDMSDDVSSTEGIPNYWTLGDSALDHLTGKHGLTIGAVHEIKPCTSKAYSTLAPHSSSALHWVAAWSAARAFLFALLSRRLRTHDQAATTEARVLWCWPSHFASEFGDLYAPGLMACGIHPSTFIIAKPSHPQDVLWAIEEGLKTSGLACVVALLDEIAWTPARRLALAAQKYQVPCLIITHPRSAPMMATATRWRVAPSPSAPHPFLTSLPGAFRLNISLERRRSDPLTSSTIATTVEWRDEAFRFHLVPDICNRQAARSDTLENSGS
ncbi:MAG: ImuA family protein [Hyphomicrobiaceae bacterium]